MCVIRRIAEWDRNHRPTHDARQGLKNLVQLLYLTALMACNLVHSMTFVSVAFVKPLPHALSKLSIDTLPYCLS